MSERSYPSEAIRAKLSERSYPSEAIRAKLPELLAREAPARGFRGEVWTCARVAEVIRKEFGVSYHPAHVSRLVRALGLSLQKPMRRANQRDKGATRRWNGSLLVQEKGLDYASGEPSLWPNLGVFRRLSKPVSSDPAPHIPPQQTTG